MLFLKKQLYLISILLLSCCIYHPAANSYPIERLNKLNPHYVDIKNGQLEYYSFGKGTPIVLITGYACDITSWDRKFLATLAQKHQVIVFNNRNVGKSKVVSDAFLSENLANDTFQLIKALHLQKPAVLGISMGGMIAQQLAVLHPNEISHLILINTLIAGKQAIRPSPVIERAMINMPKDKIGRYFFALKHFFPASQRLQMAWALAVNRFLPQTYTEINPASVMESQRKLVMQWVENNAAAEKIALLKVPVLVLNGSADTVIPPGNSDILANNLHAQLKHWKNGGHAMIFQYPEEIADTANDFITQK